MSNEELLALEVVPTGLSVEELEEFATKHLVVSLQQQGLSASEAVRRVGCPYSPAWATKQRRRFERFGAAGLLDLRKYNGKKAEVMTSEVKNIVLNIWHKDLAAGSPLIAKKTRGVCRRRGLPEPSDSTVKAYLEELPEAVKLTRGANFETYDRQAKPTLKFCPSRHANDRFQSDHVRLDIWARMLVDSAWVPVVVWLTVMLDDFSRAVAGIALSVGSANAWSITQALRHALLPKDDPAWIVHGKPKVFQCDQGADFMSHSTQAAMAVLDIEFDPDPPYYPNRKGKVERWFQTLDHACLRGLPGHMAAIGTSEGAAEANLMKLLTPEQIEREIKHWIVEEYHQHTHSATNRKPLELWQETVQLSVPSQEEVFRALLRKDDTVRKVQPVVTFQKNAGGGDYWCPDLLEHYGKEVRVAYNPEDRRRIALHDAQTGEFLAEPWLLTHPDCPYEGEVVIRERRRYRRGLKERAKQHLRQAEAQEAELREQEEWGEARDEAETMPDPAPEAPDPEEDEAEAILDELSRRHRNEGD